MKNNELNNTSTARIKPPRQVSKPFSIRLEDLEAFQEIKKQRSDH